jgi:hypothetical protein
VRYVAIVRKTGALLAACAIAVLTAVAPASSAPEERSYARLSALASFHFQIDYGSNPDSVFNGTYVYQLLYHVSTITAFDGRRVSALEGLMLADGGATLSMDMTEWRSPTTRRPVRCRAPGSENGNGQFYTTRTRGGQFSGGGGVGVTNNGLTLNPGRAIKWSVGCSATESLETHGLPGGPSMRVPAPAKSRFRGTKPFSVSCLESYSHPYQPSAAVPNAHKFQGTALFEVRITPFPASQLTATKTRLRDRVGEQIIFGGTGKIREDCP